MPLSATMHKSTTWGYLSRLGESETRQKKTNFTRTAASRRKIITWLGSVRGKNNKIINRLPGLAEKFAIPVPFDVPHTKQSHVWQEINTTDPQASILGPTLSCCTSMTSRQHALMISKLVMRADDITPFSITSLSWRVWNNNFLWVWNYEHYMYESVSEELKATNHLPSASFWDGLQVLV